jgi:hypothetical protein
MIINHGLILNKDFYEVRQLHLTEFDGSLNHVRDRTVRLNHAKGSRVSVACRVRHFPKAANRKEFCLSGHGEKERGESCRKEEKPHVSFPVSPWAQL